jgi:hypothetical protein
LAAAGKGNFFAMIAVRLLIYQLSGIVFAKSRRGFLAGADAQNVSTREI